jgi:hypothetical protein
MSNYRYGFRPVHVGLDFGEFATETAQKVSTQAKADQKQHAIDIGYGAGAQAAEGKQAKVPSNWYAVAEREAVDMSDPVNRSAFDQGFNAGYDAAAKGIGTVGPGGLTATQVLKDITIAESKKVEDVFGARQTMLDVHYKSFDQLVNDEKSKYNSMAGGLDFLAKWRSLMNDWTQANVSQLGEDMIAHYEQELEVIRQQREALIAADAALKGVKQFVSVPFPVPGVTPGAPKPAPKPVPGQAPVAGKIFGMSKGMALGVGLLVIGAVGVYFATREEYELGPDGKPRIGPDGKPIPKRKPGTAPQLGARNGNGGLPPTRMNPQAQALPMPPPVPMMPPPGRPY